MIVPLNDEFRLTADSYCFIIEKKVVRTKRETQEQYIDWVPTWFFPSIEKAINKLVEYEIRLDDSEGIDKLIESMNKIKKEIITEVKKTGIKMEGD